MASQPKQRRKQLRKRRESSSSEEESDKEYCSRAILDEAKEIQQLRKRPHGVSSVGLAWGKTYAKEEDMTNNDPFKTQTGGIVDMKALKKSKIAAEDAEMIGTTFAAETNRRDEDADMLKYVEVEMAKRKGLDEEKEQVQNRSKNPEDALYELPEHLKIQSRKKTEDMLSNQMLSGIPEVDLGIHAKIRNIEATEEAKRKLLIEKMSKRKSQQIDFVPTNMAVNFVQHNRFTIEDSAPAARKKPEPAPKPVPLRVGDVERPDTVIIDEKPKKKDTGKGEKATDDFHFEKFRKQIRRY